MSATDGFAVVPREILFDPTLSANAKLTYAALSSHANRYAQAWPSRQTLADELGISESSVKRAVKELADANVITVRGRARSDGGQTSNVYTLAGSEGPTPRVTQTRGPGSQGPTNENHLNENQGSISPTPHVIEPLEWTVEDETTYAPAFTNPDLALVVKRQIGKDMSANAIMFEQAWISWPRKVAKAAAALEFERQVKAGYSAAMIASRIVEHAKAYATFPPEEEQFIPHLRTWLHQRRWEDDPPKPRATKRSRDEQNIEVLSEWIDQGDDE